MKVLVKEVKQKVLPEPTDEWATEASEFETLAALRDDLRVPDVTGPALAGAGSL